MSSEQQPAPTPAVTFRTPMSRHGLDPCLWECWGSHSMLKVVRMITRKSTSPAQEPSAFPEDGLADVLATLARDLCKVVDVDSALNEVLRTALHLIPHAAHASISLVEAGRQVHCRAATGDLPRLVDAIRTATGEGPCLDATFRDRSVRVPDLSNEPRWPQFASRAWDAGARSMLCIQFFVEGRDIGSLNLYGRDVGDFGEECEEVALLVATHAAIALVEAEDTRDLNSALIDRDVIGQAKGVLMERYKLSAHQAFLLLSDMASSRNGTLIDMAKEFLSIGFVATIRAGQKNL